jgi:8-oxo-dGTP diphosphatase
MRTGLILLDDVSDVIAACAPIVAGMTAVVAGIVVAGILEQEGRILVCRRRADQPHPLKWEFPGGKLEPDENPETGLVRELREELGITAEISGEITRYEFAYPGKKPILLIFMQVAFWHGEIENRIFDAVAWEPLERLADYDMLEGDAPFLEFFTDRRS